MAYTDFLQLVQARQSDRSYDKERPVETEKLERILEAGRLAPSACNAQASLVRMRLCATGRLINMEEVDKSDWAWSIISNLTLTAM